MLKKHVFGSFNHNNSEKHRLSFEGIFWEHLTPIQKNEPTLGSSGGGGVHGTVCWLIAYYAYLIKLLTIYYLSSLKELLKIIIRLNNIKENAMIMILICWNTLYMFIHTSK